MYRLLLRFYPGEFRDDYGREMMLAFRERLSHDRTVGTGAVMRLWAQLLMDSIVRAPGEHLDVLRQDLRYALRSLRRAPLFTFTAVATLALGVGANTAIFSVVHAVALRPLPYESADRLVRIWERNGSLSITGFAVSLPNFVSWQERARTLELAGWRSGSVTLRSTAEPIRVGSVTISPEYFRILRATPMIGRAFAASDAAPGAERVALIRDSLWRSYFGGDPRVVGTPVTIAGDSHTIVGVIAESSTPLSAEFYMPLRVDVAAEQRDNHIASVGCRDVLGVRLARTGTDQTRAVRAARRGVLRAAHRVGERREPDARARRRAKARDGPAHGDWSGTPSPGASGAHRRAGPGRRRGNRRHPPGLLGCSADPPVARVNPPARG